MHRGIYILIGCSSQEKASDQYHRLSQYSTGSENKEIYETSGSKCTKGDYKIKVCLFTNNTRSIVALIIYLYLGAQVYLLLHRPINNDWCHIYESTYSTIII